MHNVDLILEQFTYITSESYCFYKPFLQHLAGAKNIILVSTILLQRLKYKIYLCRSIDRYDTDPGGQGTYRNGHKIAFSLRPKWIRTVECGILAIKKTSVKTLQIGLYSVILNVLIKNVQEKDNCNIEKTKFMIFYANFISWDYYLFWLTPCIFDFLFVNTHHDHERIKVKH